MILSDLSNMYAAIRFICPPPFTPSPPLPLSLPTKQGSGIITPKNVLNVYTAVAEF
jgi:hypothetical protein